MDKWKDTESQQATLRWYFDRPETKEHLGAFRFCLKQWHFQNERSNLNGNSFYEALSQCLTASPEQPHGQTTTHGLLRKQVTDYYSKKAIWEDWYGPCK